MSEARKLLNSKASVSIELVETLANSTQIVFSTQAFTQTNAKKPYICEIEQLPKSEISGVIDLKSNDFTGVMLLSFPKLTYLKVISRMLGEEFQELSLEIADGASELTNIVFGHAKVKLNKKNYELEMAIPSVVLAENRSVLNLAKGPLIVIPFESDIGFIYIEIWVC